MLGLIGQMVATESGSGAGLRCGCGVLPMVLFYVFGGITVGGALATCVCTRIMRAAVGMLAALAGMAGLYLLLQAEFLAAVQLVVYVGGTGVVMIFGIMLMGRSSGGAERTRKAEVIWAGALAGAMAAALIVLFVRVPWGEIQRCNGGMKAAGPTMENLGVALISSQGYLVALEMFSVLLLAVMIGVAYLVKGRGNGPAARSAASGTGRPATTPTVRRPH